MLFNSGEFIFGFLPLVIAGYLLFGRLSRNVALGWLIVASVFFYAWWRPLNVLIIAPSIVVNFVIARWMLGLGEGARPATRRALLATGIVFNVLFLGYFKYVNFFTNVVNDVSGTSFVLEQVVLPLGISFITFQKIAFLVDVYAGRVKAFSPRDYCLFVLFFPQLIAGPIVHYGEMMPQFHRVSGRLEENNVAVGLTLFAIGLFKKVVIADGIAGHVTPIYAAAASGGSIDLLMGWVAAVGFTLQIYFDFSGYSDMALGLARFFGIRLPANFDSPLKARNVIDFWLRWHITLTRFLTAYIYNPLVLTLTRRRVAKGLSGVSARNAPPGAFFQLLAGPTILTMLISGLWHGAGYTFLLWGLLHGVYLAINHAWRLTVPKLWNDRARYDRIMGPIGWLLTFLAVAVAMVFFKAPSVRAAVGILHGMVGLGGVALPQKIVDRLHALPESLSAFISVGSLSPTDLVVCMGWMTIGLVIVLGLPNSLELVARYESALGFKRSPTGRFTSWLRWEPSLSWAGVFAMLGLTSMLMLGGKSEFLYWQF